MARIVLTKSIAMLAAIAMIACAGEAFCGQQMVVSGYAISQKTGRVIKKGLSIKINGEVADHGAVAPDGEYRIYLEPGSNVVTFIKPGFLDATREICFINIINHEYERHLNVHMEPDERSVRFLGRVVDRVTAEPIKKAEMRIGSEIMFTDGDGRFECLTKPGKITVSAKADGRWPKTAEFDSDTYDGGPVTILMERHTLASRVHGVVAERSNHEPIRNAVVDIGGERALTDDEGRFIIDRPRSGRLFFKCTAEGYETAAKMLDLKPGDHRLSIFLKKKGASR